MGVPALAVLVQAALAAVAQERPLTQMAPTEPQIPEAVAADRAI